MNFALGTLLLFLLVVPGIAFRHAYTLGPLTKKYSKLSAFDDFIWAIIPGLIIQLLSAWIVNKVSCSYYVDFTTIGKIFMGGPDVSKEIEKIGNNIGLILIYNIVLIIISGILGIILRKVFRYFHFDHLFRLFRFSNEWHYILRGETDFFIEHKQSPKKGLNLYWDVIRSKGRHDYTIINAVVRGHKNHCYIYSGILLFFNLNRDGSLDTIVLKGVKRIKYSELKKETNECEYYFIPTDIVVLKYSEIITISVESKTHNLIPRQNDSTSNEKLSKHQEIDMPKIKLREENNDSDSSKGKQIDKIAAEELEDEEPEKDPKSGSAL